MPDRRTPTAAERSEALVQSAAERAVGLALAGTERAQADAVARALRDERVDRELHDHELHLQAINGSQAKMATSLEQLVGTNKTQVAVTEALGKQISEQTGATLSRWGVRAALLAALAGYGSILAVVLTQH